ncbi:MAG: hypothetical protein Ct9H300mP31_15120 [Acidimicrobiaceae bacterium]|nr:MAG: hypothetical protein Ct9H300mP31_15120 [Acidimicrobiaceae bacterium]
MVLDTARHRASRGERDLDLTAKEFALLRYFMTRPGDVVSRERFSWTTCGTSTPTRSPTPCG